MHCLDIAFKLLNVTVFAPKSSHKMLFERGGISVSTFDKINHWTIMFNQFIERTYNRFVKMY